MCSLLFTRNISIPKIVVNLLNISRTFSQKRVACKSSLFFPTLFEKPRLHYIETHLCRPHLIKRHQQTQYKGGNTNVINNVILYKFENVRFLKVTQVIGVGSLFFWALTIIYLYKDNFFSDLLTKPLRKFVEDNMLCILLISSSTLLGPCMFTFFYMFCSRLIKCVILNKGGKQLTFITLHPLKSKCVITVPVEQVRCLRDRTDRYGLYSFVKIHPYKLQFLIDKGGTYVNEDLFDHTIGWCKYMK